MSRLQTLAILILLAVLTACSGGDSGGETNQDAAALASPAAAATPDLPTNAEGDLLVARVNGEAITYTQYQRELARAEQESLAADGAALAATVLDRLIEQRLIRQAADDLNITITQAEIEAEYQAHREIAGDDAAWTAWLTANGYTDEEFRSEVLPLQLITSRVLDNVVVQPTGDVTQVRARHILVNTEAEAEAVLTRLQNGEDFAAIAAEVSRDATTREEGGDLGWFIREDLFMTPELADIAFGLEPGQIAGPIATRLGYHIIQTLEVGQRQADPGEAAVIAQNQFTEWLESVYAEAEIERYL